MNIPGIVLEYLAWFPPALLCFFPMKDQLRYSFRKTVLIIGAVMTVSSLASGFLQYWFQLPVNATMIPMFAVTFLPTAAALTRLCASCWPFSPHP